MKKMVTLWSLVAIVMLIAATSFAVDPGDNGAGTMWGKLGSGITGVDPRGNGCTYDQTAALSNWQWQYGSSSFVGVYSSGYGWYGTTSGADDGSIDVRADVEMYYQSAMSGEKIYFHIGNPFTVTTAQNQAIVNYQQTTNHAMYVGVTLPSAETSLASQWEGFGSALTGKVLKGMTSPVNDIGVALGSTMDISFLLSVDGNSWTAPTSAGTKGADNTISDSTMWWNPTVSGGTGTHGLRWLVQIYPTATQDDGDYTLDPMVSVSPAL